MKKLFGVKNHMETLRSLVAEITKLREELEADMKNKPQLEANFISDLTAALERSDETALTLESDYTPGSGNRAW
jgi:hypothetical protein